MSRLRYEMITSALLLMEDEKEIDNNLTKLISFISFIPKPYSKNYILCQNNTIDVSIIPFKGRSQYIC